MHVTLDLFDISGTDSPVFFGRHRRFWNEMANESVTKGISLTLTTFDDPSFNGYEFGVKAHIRCEEYGVNSNYSTKKARGYSHSWH